MSISIWQWLTIIFGVVGVVSVLLAIRFHRVRRPYWAIETGVLIRDFTSGFSDLQVRYRENEIKNFSVSVIMFWNGGRETVRARDVAQTSPLGIIPREGVEILDARVLESNNPAGGVRCRIAGPGDGVGIQFEFMEHGDGAVFQVFHTGTSSDDLTVQGHVVGAGSPVKKRVGNKWAGFLLVAGMAGFFAAVGSLIGAVIMTVIGFTRNWTAAWDWFRSDVTRSLPVAGVVLGLMLAWAAFEAVRTTTQPKRLKFTSVSRPE